MSELETLVGIVLVALNWIAAAHLASLVQEEPALVVLRERALAALLIASVATVGLVVIIVAEPTGVVDLVSRALLAIITLPAIYWLWLYRRLP